MASLAGGLAQSEAWLIAARTVQGAGAAIVSPAPFSVITTIFEESSERNRALGMGNGRQGGPRAPGFCLAGA